MVYCSFHRDTTKVPDRVQTQIAVLNGLAVVKPEGIEIDRSWSHKDLVAVLALRPKGLLVYEHSGTSPRLGDISGKYTTHRDSTQDFMLACAAAGIVRREKSVWITHILGSVNGRTPACPWASLAAKLEATAQQNTEKAAEDKAPSEKHARLASLAESNDASAPKKMKQTMLKTYTGLDMLFSSSEAEAIQAQALCAITLQQSQNAYAARDDAKASDIIPWRKVVGGRLLDEAASTVKERLLKILDGQALGAITDSWKSLTKDSVSGVCVNVEYNCGPGMCQQFCNIIDRLGAKFNCKVIYFVTDTDGGSKKGRELLGKQCIYLILPSCWAHQFQLILGDFFKVNKFAAQTVEMTTALIGWINNHSKVQKIFDHAQHNISKDCLGYFLILANLVANLMCWTTHCIAFMCVFCLQDALQFAVMQSRGTIVSAQVGAAKGTEAITFATEAGRFCDMIMDVLLSLAGMFLHMVEHPEPEVAKGMTTRLKKCWKDCDQPLFLLALILNPYEQLSCFGPKTGLNHFNCLDLLVSMYQQMNSQPDNEDTPAERKKESQANFEKWMGRNPIAVWVAFKTPEIVELADYAVLLLKIVVKQTQCCNRLKLVKLDKMTKIAADIKVNHLEHGLVTLRVLHYRDLLDNQDDNNDVPKRGSALVLSEAGWRTVMTKWIADAQAAEAKETSSNSDSDDNDNNNLPKTITPAPQRRDLKWKKTTLAQLFGGAKKKHAGCLSQEEIEAEAKLMVSLVEAEALAEAEEDARLDDGAVEIGSEEEYGQHCLKLVEAFHNLLPFPFEYFDKVQQDADPDDESAWQPWQPWLLATVVQQKLAIAPITYPQGSNVDFNKGNSTTSFHNCRVFLVSCKPIPTKVLQGWALPESLAFRKPQAEGFHAAKKNDSGDESAN
ncbi:hypothetical protein B0H10DRAFT_1943534 [Mycena sp. CBHHK59/15]|nr:hypothetical protein B0H10DRAFT_1943534 [Mycena sp. CBHHK59/15]